MIPDRNFRRQKNGPSQDVSDPLVRKQTTTCDAKHATRLVCYVFWTRDAVNPQFDKNEHQDK